MFALDNRMIGMYESLLFDLDVNIPIIGILTPVQTCHGLVIIEIFLSGNGK